MTERGSKPDAATRPRRRKLRFYGVTTFTRYIEGQKRYVAGVFNRREFAQMLGTSDYFLSGYSSETGNATEVSLCTAKPHTLFYADDIGKVYCEVNRKGRP